jgi:hypothetical protein
MIVWIWSMFGSASGKVQLQFDYLTEDVADEDMGLLDSGCGMRGNKNGLVNQFERRTTTLSKQTHRQHLSRTSSLKSSNNVCALTRRGNPDQGISRLPKCFHLPAEDLVITEIIANTRED